MKKLSILIAVMLVLTIGGVYATWSYAGTNDIADSFAEAKVTITDAKLVGANGTYEIKSNLVLTIDPNPESATSTHEAMLVFGSNDSQEPYLTVTFKPSVNAPADIKANAVPTELYFGTTHEMKYKIDQNGNYSETGTPVDIFKFDNPSNSKFEENVDWEKQADGSFTYTLTLEDLKKEIMLNQTFILDLKSEHDKFREALSGNIVARVTDGVVTTDATAATEPTTPSTVG